MKRIIAILCLSVATWPAFSQSPYERPKSLPVYPAANSIQAQMEEMQLRISIAELERQQKALDDLREELEDAIDEAVEGSKREAEERDEAIQKKIEGLADDFASRERLASAKDKTLIYAVLAFLVIFVVAHQIIRGRRNSQENVLKPHEKAGVLISVTGVGIMFWALIVSHPWAHEFDIWHNIMLDFMTVGIWPYFQTRFVVLWCVGLMLYGALVYLDILKAPRRLLSWFESSSKPQ